MQIPEDALRKYRSIQALAASSSAPGERSGARAALQRLQARWPGIEVAAAEAPVDDLGGLDALDDSDDPSLSWGRLWERAAKTAAGAFDGAVMAAAINRIAREAVEVTAVKQADGGIYLSVQIHATAVAAAQRIGALDVLYTVIGTLVADRLRNIRVREQA